MSSMVTISASTTSHVVESSVNKSVDLLEGQKSSSTKEYTGLYSCDAARAVMKWHRWEEGLP